MTRTITILAILALALAACTGDEPGSTRNAIDPPRPPAGAFHGSFQAEQVPRPRPAPARLSGTREASDPARWRPSLHNPGGVNGDRPERPTPMPQRATPEPGSTAPRAEPAAPDVSR